VVDFDKDATYARAATNPAGPLGLQQTAEDIGEGRAAYAQSGNDPSLQPWQPQTSWLDTAKTWYTGANQEGTENGWDSPFYRAAFDTYNAAATKAAESGNGSDFFAMFDSPGATGVAAWDDPTGRFSFGDVFQDGQLLTDPSGAPRNIYTDYDKATADVIMGEFMFSKEEKERMFSADDRQEQMASEVAAKRELWSKQARYAPQAEQYRRDVDQVQETLSAGPLDDIGAAALGAGGGVAMGAAGGPIGATVMGAIGLVGGLMNKDHLSELAARAVVDTQRANEYNDNPFTTIGAGVGNLAPLAMRASMPLSNMYQGYHDIISPKGWGDKGGDAGFYRTDMGGNRVLSGAEQGIDIALSVGDSALQFSSPASRSLYMATMGLAVYGGVNDQLMGATFNPRIGGYDSFDTGGERMAAIGSTFIDVAQMGMAHWLGAGAASARAAVSGERAAADGFTGVLDRVGDKVLGGAGMKQATQYETINGIRFGLDDGLNVVGSRMTLQALVPSEFMRWLPTTWSARRAATNAGRGGAGVTRDDLYTAAWMMSSKGSTFRNAVINAYAEGSEEFVQAILDPWSVSENPTMQEIVTATLYGAAGGAGMSVGRLNWRPSNDAFEKQHARTLMKIRTGQLEDSEEFDAKFEQMWSTSSPMDKRRMSTMRPSEEREMNLVLEANAKLMEMEAAYNSPIGIANMANLSQSRFEALHKKASKQGQGSLVLLPMAAGTVVIPGGGREALQYAANAAVMSAHQVGLELAGIAKGMEGQWKGLQGAQERLIARLRDLQGVEGEQAQFDREDLQRQIDEHQAMIEDVTATLPFADTIASTFRDWLDAFRREQDPDRRRAMIAQINTLLLEAGQGRSTITVDGQPPTPQGQELIRRAVELQLARHPLINTGSFGLFIPQVSAEMTDNNIHSTVYMHHSTLKAPNADHDGDTGVVQHEKWLPAQERRAKRQGAQYVKDVTGDDGRTVHKAVVDMPDNEATYMRLFHEAMVDAGSLASAQVHGELNTLIDELRTVLRRSTGGPIDDPTADSLLAAFKQGVVDGNADARETFLNGLLNSQPNAVADLLGMAETNPALNGVPFVPWFMWNVNFAFDRIQRNLATRFQTDPTSILESDPGPLMTDVSVAYMERIAVQDAATAGQQLTATLDPTRAAQQLHYSALYRALTVAGTRESEGSFTTPEQDELVAMYAQLGSGIVMSELDMTLSKDSIETNVMYFLDRIVKETTSDFAATRLPELRLLMANLVVPDIRPAATGGYSVEVGSTTLLQLLLRKALEIEENKLTGAPDDAAARLRISKLRTLAYPKTDGHSETARTVIVELFGQESLFNLVGDSSMFLGTSMTLDQLKNMVSGMSSERRSQFFHNLSRSAVYFKDGEVKDPPWTREQLESGEVSAFAILIDALKAHVDTSAAARAGRDATLGKNFRKDLALLGDLITRHQSTTKGLPAGNSTEARIAVLRDLLDKRPDIVSRISTLIPEASALGVFQVLDSGEVRQARWLEEVLVHPDPAKAEVMMYVQLKLAEFNQKGGSVYTERDAQGEKVQSRGNVRYDQLDSRFLQTVYYLGRIPNGMELMRFIDVATKASTLESLFDQINAEPDWRNGREKLLPYHDDVSLYETRPEDIWQADMPYALQREAMELFHTSMDMLEKSAAQATEIALENRDVIAGMQAVEAGQSTDPRYVEMLHQLDEWIELRQSFPDGVGPRARDHLLELFTEALVRLHDKGKIDEQARGFGESLVTMDSFGWKGGPAQEVDALTSMDWNDVQTNLTHLVDGPIRLQLDDGSDFILDMSTRSGVLSMLSDPRTQQFALAVLQYTVRDVNRVGVLQTYQDTGMTGEDTKSLAAMLAPNALRVALFDNVGSPVEQAHRYISMLESNMRREALNSPQGATKDERQAYLDRNDAAHHPIQHMIDDLLIAYTHGPKWKTADKRKLRDRLVMQVADAIKAMANVSDTEHMNIQDLVVGALQEQFTGDSSMLDFTMMDPEKKKLTIESLRVFLTNRNEAEMAALDTRRDAEYAAARDDDERNYVLEKYGALEAAALERSKQYVITDDSIRIPGLLSSVVQSTVNATQLTGEPTSDLFRKVHILDLLGKGNRANRFRTKADIELYHKVRGLLDGDPMRLFTEDIDTLTTEEWNILGGWAAAVSISDLTTRSSSEVALLPLVFGAEGNLIRGYYDPTYGNLVSGFFNPQLLVAAKKLATQTNVKQPVTSGEMVDQLMRGLFAEGNLGVWTDRVPVESMKLRRVVETASTGAAIQVEGNDPKTMAPYMASGRVSSLLPDPAKHHSQVALPGVLGQGLLDPMSILRLQGRFVSRVTVELTVPGATVDPADLDLTSVLSVSEFNDDTRTAPYRVFHVTTIQDKLDALEEKYGSSLGPVALNIEYVDVDKLPSGPDSREWANNIFFVGVGREGYRTSTFGGLAALYFGSEGLSKLGQQNPLDAATKKGKRYRAHVTTPLAVVQSAEAAGQTISEILWAKVDIMMKAHFPTGDLLLEDAPSIYELMKMRHVVVGKNAAGQKEVWWPQRLIELEAQGLTPELTDIQLVPLNDSIAQQLHSGKSHGGLRTRLTQRVLNLQDISPFASLDSQRLRDLGLDRLGEPAQVWNSPVTTVGMLQRASLAREDQDHSDSIAQRVNRWQSHRKGILENRSRTRRGGEGRFDIKKINKKNAKKAIDMLDPGAIPTLFRRSGVPFADLEDPKTPAIMRQIQRLRWHAENINPNTVMWFHDHESGSVPGSGILGRVSVQDDFATEAMNGPTYGDTIVINLTSIERENRGNAIAAAKEVIRSYTKLGLTIVLVEEQGRRDIINQLQGWLGAGSEGYKSIAGASHFYAPIDEDPRDGETRRAQISTLTATHVMDTDGIGVGMVTNQLGTYLSENGGITDLQYDPSTKRVVANVIPAGVLATGSAGDDVHYSFAYPSEGDTAAWANLREALVPLLDTQEGRDHLKALASGYQGKNDGNPSKVPLYRHVSRTGEIIPGVLDMDEALVQLRDILASGNQPVQPGRSLQLGSFVPSISATGEILLNRIGFKPPDIIRMGEMLNAPAGKNKREEGDPPGLRIAVAPAKLDTDATIGGKFTIKKVKKSPRGGMVIIGEAELSGYAKTILEGTGFKMGAVPMPSSLRFKDIPLKTHTEAAGIRVTRVNSEQSVIGKEATPGLVDNFADMFLLTSVNFQHDLMEFFWGKDVTTAAADEYGSKWDKLQMLLKAWSHEDHGMPADDLVRMLDKDFGQAMIENGVNDLGTLLWRDDWKTVRLMKGESNDEPQKRIVTVLLTALAAPGIELEHVLGTSGLMSVASHTEGLGVRRLPAIVTDALADSSYPETRDLLIGRANALMPKDPKTGKRVVWFDNEFNAHMTLEEQVNGKWVDRPVVGHLQIQLPIVNDVTGDTLAYAALTSDDTMSPHVVNVQNAADGGYLVPGGAKFDAQGNLVKDPLAAMDEVFGDNELLRFESGDGRLVWEMLTRLKENDPSYSPWERKLPYPEMHFANADKKVRYYTKPIDKKEWDPDDTTKALEVADEMLEFLGLSVPSIEANRLEIDYLVRQWYGAPAASTPDEVIAATLTAEEYIDAVRKMRANLSSGLQPLHSGDVPLEHVMFWRKVYEAQKARQAAKVDSWAPVKTEKLEKGEVVTTRATDWADWVATIIGQTRDSAESFDSLFAVDLDGFYHTYQGSTSDFLVTALSLDEKLAAKLLDPETNRRLLSIDPLRDAVLASPIIIDSQQVTYEALAGHDPEFSAAASLTAATSPRRKRRERQEEYRVNHKITKQKDTTVREYARKGVFYQESSRKTNEFLTFMVNLSIAMRLANPALYVSAMIEVPFRNMLERSANLLTGTYTGVGAAAISATGAKLGIAPQYTDEELAKVDMLVEQLGESDSLLGEVFREMTYARPLEAKTGLGRGMEHLAGKISRFTSDPRWGMKANSPARRYVEGALDYMNQTGSLISVDQFVGLMSRDPLWLMKNAGPGFSAHQAGINQVAQVRAMRPTVTSRAIMSPIDRMTNSGSGFVNGSGHLLKIPFMFTRFGVNTLMTITGLDALDQTAAMMMDGRKSPELMKRMGALARRADYDSETARRMDYTDVLEGIDLGRIFARSAVTQTGLMAAAIMATGFSLGGEDEEEKRRRKLATYLNIPYIRDPREASNDIRFVDAVFLDNVPLLDTWFKQEGIDRSVVVPHWMMRQFLSPILGTMRFFETGDVNEIRYGFWDAAAAVPNSVVGVWREADQTATMLSAAAQDASVDPQKDQQVSQFIVNIAGVYEKALVENQFVNAIRQALDPIDRNPWLIPKIDEATGEIARTQGYALPQETNALVDIQTTGENGRDPQNRQAYLTRSPNDALLHGYAENNGTFAALMAMATGGLGSSFLRSNMVPKSPTALAGEKSKAEVEALVLSAFEGQGGQPALTQREILQTLRDRETAADRRWDNDKLNAEAQAIFEGQAKLDFTTGAFDTDALQVLNKDAVNGVFKSLKAGAVQFGDPIMSGFWADDATRDAIAAEWLDEIIQEGMALGLSQDSAKYRADRFWWGDSREGWVGLRELLYSNKIPKTGRIEYLQQNGGYVIGPDGMPWATPFEKQNMLGTVFPAPRQLLDPGPGLTLDARANTVDIVNNINTGLAGLLQKPTTPEKFEPNDKILDDAKKKDYGSDPTYSAFKRFPGSGGSYGPNFNRMYTLPQNRFTPRPDDIPFINVNTPYVRRARVNTERVSSDRGRLKQWQ
jgi:hypothetical protein